VVWGWCYASRGFITLHTRGQINRRELYILLAHEFTHYLDYKTRTGKWRNALQPHGERFQRMLWGVIPRPLWVRASRGRWIDNSSAHRPEFQPDLRDPVLLLVGTESAESEHAHEARHQGGNVQLRPLSGMPQECSNP
jgi:hypothetical protein